MKKTITHSDGTIEVIEGTPEEISEYTKKLNRAATVKEGKSRRKILNEVEERLAKLREEFAPYRPVVTIPYVKPWPCNSECYACNGKGKDWYSVVSPTCICLPGCERGNPVIWQPIVTTITTSVDSGVRMVPQQTVTITDNKIPEPAIIDWLERERREREERVQPAIELPIPEPPPMPTHPDQSGLMRLRPLSFI